MVEYTRYEKYRNSGVEWIGDIPEEWAVLKIKRITKIRRGASPRPIDDPIYFDDTGEYAWVRISDITESGMYLNSTKEQLSDLGSRLSIKLLPGDLFLSIAATVGKPCITNIKCCIHDGFVYFPDFKGDKRFLYYLFESGEPYKGLGKLGTQLNLNSDTVGSIVIAIPSEEEQTQISNFLTQTTAEIDSLIANKERLIDLLENQLRATIIEAVTKGLNPDFNIKDSGVNWIGRVPEHWTVCKVNYRYSIELGKMLDEKRIVGDSLVPYLRNQDVQWGFINTDDLPEMDISETERDRYTVKSGDLLVCEGGDVGRAALWRGNDNEVGFQKALHRVRPRNREADTAEFLYFVLLAAKHSGAFSENDSKATISHLTGEKFRQYRFAFPPIDEQTEIADKLAHETKEINDLIQELKESIVLLNEYRQSLIFEAVTGKIDVRQTVAEQSAV